MARRPQKRWERIRGMRAEALDATIYAMAVRQLVGVDLTRWENELRQLTSARRLPTAIRSKWLSGEHD